MDWIRNFTNKTKEVVKGEEINLELIYIGKKHRERINKENLSEVWDEEKIRRFHARLDLIYQSKMQLGKSIRGDKTLKNLKTLLDAGGDGQGWTIIGQGSNDMAVIMDENMVIETLDHLEKKKSGITKESFTFTLHLAIKDAKKSLKSQKLHKYCHHIYFPTGNMVCVDCQRPIDQESNYRIQVTNQKRTISSNSESVATGRSCSSRFVSN